MEKEGIFMEDYVRAARDFVENEKQFHLGAIPTEQSNPLTRGLSAKIRRSTQEGVKTILAADQYIPSVAKTCFETDAFRKLTADIRRCMEEGHRVILSSVGASGRMALQLDSTWRKFWQDLIVRLPVHAQEFTALSLVTDSFMTGGDRACVRSVENFEDYQTFGAQQTIDSGIEKGDVLVVLAECGLSSSTIGSAVQGDEMGIATYYLYYNPKDILCEHLERARKVFSHTGITFIPMFAGNMAVAGSTRMQVTTIELLIMGAALEIAAGGYLQDHLTAQELETVGVGVLAPEKYAEMFEDCVRQLSCGEALSGMAKAVEFEAETYTKGGLVTYITHDYLQDILTDTTERQPTFTLPPFRRTDDHTSPLSWAYAKDPLYPAEVAWQHIIRRPLKGLDWTREDYIRMGADPSIVAHPPEVGSDQLSYYDLGWSDDATRYSQHPAQLVLVDIDGLSAKNGCVDWYTPAELDQLRAVVDSVPDRNTLLHGDYHANNIMVADGELLLIDMGDVSYGHPIFDFLATAATQANLVELDPAYAEHHTHMPVASIKRLWSYLLEHYFDDKTPAEVAAIDQQIRLFSKLKVAMCPVVALGAPRQIIEASVNDAKANFLPRTDELIGSLDW